MQLRLRNNIINNLNTHSKNIIKTILLCLNNSDVLPYELIELILSFIIIKPIEYSSCEIISGRFYSGNKTGNIEYALYNKPYGITLNKNNNIIISDTMNNLIKIINNNGIIETIGGLNNEFNKPMGITCDKNNNIIIANSLNHTIDMLKKNGDVITIAGSGIVGYIDVDCNSSQFNRPSSVAINSDGDIFVTDEKNNKIRKIDMKNKLVETYFDCTNVFTIYDSMLDLTIDKDNNIYITNAVENCIIKILPDKSWENITTNLLNDISNPIFKSPRGITTNNYNEIIIADSCNSFIKNVSNNIVTTYVNNGNYISNDNDIQKCFFYKCISNDTSFYNRSHYFSVVVDTNDIIYFTAEDYIGKISPIKFSLDYF